VNAVNKIPGPKPWPIFGNVTFFLNTEPTGNLFYILLFITFQIFNFCLRTITSCNYICIIICMMRMHTNDI
jgi:hypothetical protein